jgi:hypothetical protein
MLPLRAAGATCSTSEMIDSISIAIPARNGGSYDSDGESSGEFRASMNEIFSFEQALFLLAEYSVRRADFFLTGRMRRI